MSNHENQNKKIAIIGANGVVGNALTSHLYDTYDVVKIDRPDIDILEDREKLGRSLAGVDTVIHLAGVFGPANEGKESWRSPHTDPTNHELFMAALTSAEASGVKKFIHASSIHVEDTMEFSAESSGLLVPKPGEFATATKSGYGKSKRSQEAYLQNRASHFDRGAVSIRLGGVTRDNYPLREHPDETVLTHEHKVWVAHGELADLVGRIIEFDGRGDYDVVYAVSENDGKFHDTANRYGWEPSINSAEYKK